MSINFTARQVSSTTIQHRLPFRNYTQSDVSIVELDRCNYSDMDALHDAAYKWENNGAKYARAIYNKAESGGYYHDILKDHYYALTTQNADFRKLRPDMILGLMVFSETKNPENEILYLEVNPSTSKSLNRIREYKQVGRKLVDFVHSKFKKKDIFIQSDRDAIKFYKKMGCEQPSKAPEKVCQLYLRALK